MELLNYTPSKMLYGVNFSDPIVKDMGTGGHTISSVSFQAIGTVTKRGVISVSFGYLGKMYRDISDFSVEHFQETLDGRYGLDVLAKWDGEYLFAKNTPLKEMNEYADFLDPILNNIPDLPKGYDGWFKL